MFEGPGPIVNPVNTQFSLMMLNSWQKALIRLNFPPFSLLKNKFVTEIRNAKEISNIFFAKPKKQ